MALLKTNLHLGPALLGAPSPAFRTPVRSQGTLTWQEERQEKME